MEGGGDTYHTTTDPPALRLSILGGGGLLILYLDSVWETEGGQEAAFSGWSNLSQSFLGFGRMYQRIMATRTGTFLCCYLMTLPA